MKREENIRKSEDRSNLIAVDFSQRIKGFANETGLEPKIMWLKPVFGCNYSIRQLKQTAMESTALLPARKLRDLIFKKPASCNLQPATIKRISTVFNNTPPQVGAPGLAIRAAGSVFNN